MRVARSCEEMIGGIFSIVMPFLKLWYIVFIGCIVYATVITKANWISANPVKAVLIAFFSGALFILMTGGKDE